MKNNEGFINVDFVMESIDNKFGRLLKNRGSLDVNTFKNITLCLYAFKFINPEKFKLISENSVEFNFDFFKEIALEFDKIGLKDVYDELINFNFSNHSNVRLSNFFDFFEEMSVTKHSYKDGFDELIVQFSKQEGKITSIFNTPETICSIYKVLIGDSNSIFDPACGTGSLLNTFQEQGNSKLFGQEISRNVFAIARLRFVFDINISLTNRDSLSDNDDRKYDTVVVNPPFNMSVNSFEYERMPYLHYGTPARSNANFYWLQYGLSKLNEEGKCIILLSNSSQNSSGTDAEIRRNYCLTF